MFLKKGFYTLEDIKKILIYTPLLFIIFLSTLLVIVLFIILENKKNAQIDLLLQKDRFDTYKILNNYVDDVKYGVHTIFDSNEKVLNQAVFELNGYIKSLQSEDLEVEYILEYIKHLEKEQDIEFVIFNKKSFKVYYGLKHIEYLQSLTNSKLTTKEFTKHMIRNIYYMGDDSLQYWIDNSKKYIKLSYFIDSGVNNLYLGAFSKIKHIKHLLKEGFLNSMVSKSRGLSSYFWFYDYEKGVIYNYKNRGESRGVKEVLGLDNRSFYNSLLKKSEINNFNEHLSIYDFKRYNFLLSTKPNLDIKNNTTLKKIEEIKKRYNSMFVDYTLLILVATLILISITTSFSKFINKIVTRYNSRLNVKNELLRKWKNRYELAIIASNDGLLEINLKDERIYFSNRWLNMFGYEHKEITSLEEWFNLIHPNDRQRVISKFEEHKKYQNIHFICEYRLRDSSGKYRWVLVRGKAFKDSSGELNRMPMMTMDINDRKRLTKELKDIELLVEVGRIVIFKWRNSNSLDVEYVSKSISSFGFSKTAFEQNNMSYFEFIHKDDIDILQRSIENAIKNGSDSFSLVYRVVDIDKNIRWVFNRSILLKDHDGNVTHFYGYISDITSMKLTEEELKQRVAIEVEKNIEKDRLLIHQNKLASMGEMLGSIAHQWRQPLNNINLLIYFIRDNYFNEKFTKEDLNSSIMSAKEQIDYMSRTIDDFRNFYKPVMKNRSSFNIKKAVKEAYKIVKTDFEKCNIKLIVSNTDIEITNYKNEFEQVIVNILSNAKDAAIIKAKEQKFQAIVEVEIFEERSAVVVLLRNNCGNVESEVLERMFEPYFTTKFEDKGTGIGLYMSKTIIEKNMNGKIEVQNLKEDSLEFKIVLPI